LSPAEGNILETRLRELAGSDFWVNLIGYSLNINPDLARCFTDIDHRIPDEIVVFSPTRHSEHIHADAKTIRDHLGLAEDHLVWEIEVPVSDPSEKPCIRIVDPCENGEGISSRHSSELAETANWAYDVVCLRNNPSFSGCVKAYFGAQSARMATLSYIQQFAVGRASND
jgi:hypothetical protein